MNVIHKCVNKWKLITQSNDMSVCDAVPHNLSYFLLSIFNVSFNSQGSV